MMGVGALFFSMASIPQFEIPGRRFALATAKISVIERLRREGIAIEDCRPDFGDPTPAFNTLWQAGMASNSKSFSDDQLALRDPGLQALTAQSAPHDRIRSLVDYFFAATTADWLDRNLYFSSSSLLPAARSWRCKRRPSPRDTEASGIRSGRCSIVDCARI